MMQRNRRHKWLLLLVVVSGFSGAEAQTRDQRMEQQEPSELARRWPSRDGRRQSQQLRERVDSVLSERYYRTPYDTNYVVRPEGRLTLKLRLNQTGNDFHAQGTVNDIYSKADLSTSHKTTFAVVGIYRGIGVGVAVNPYKWSGIYKDYEFNLNYYSSRLSLDASYQRSTTLAGDIERGDDDSRLESGDVTLKVANLSGYYSFNHRRFSFPAAFTQSYIQRR